MKTNDVMLDLENKVVLGLQTYGELRARADVLEALCKRASEPMVVELDESYLRFPSLQPVMIDDSMALPEEVLRAIALGFVNGVLNADEDTKGVLAKWVTTNGCHFYNTRTREVSRHEESGVTYDLNLFKQWIKYVDDYKDAKEAEANDDSSN